jgi:hypothetical protein
MVIFSLKYIYQNCLTYYIKMGKKRHRSFIMYIFIKAPITKNRPCYLKIQGQIISAVPPGLAISRPLAQSTSYTYTSPIYNGLGSRRLLHRAIAPSSALISPFIISTVPHFHHQRLSISVKIGLLLLIIGFIHSIINHIFRFVNAFIKNYFTFFDLSRKFLSLS